MNRVRRESRIDLRQLRARYELLLETVPDLKIEIERELVTGEAVALEIRVYSVWPEVELPAWVIFACDDEGRLGGDPSYYYPASALRQAIPLHEPQKHGGRVSTAITYPLTIARALVRGPLRRRRRSSLAPLGS